MDKVYYAKVQGIVDEVDQEIFAVGMSIGNGETALPSKLEILYSGEISEIRVTIQEGKFHQVKRMLAARGKPVLYLKRVRMGNLPLDPALEPGTYRYLTEDEVESLRNF